MLKELWIRFVTLYRGSDQAIPKKKKGKKAKWFPEEALQIAVKSREVKDKGEKIYPFECRVLKNARRAEKAFLNDQ